MNKVEFNELNQWHELSEKIIEFINNCSDDIKPYILGQLVALTETIHE